MQAEKKVCVTKFASDQAVISEIIKPHDFKRIYMAILSFTEDVRVIISFRQDNGKVVVSGTIEAAVVLSCSRCLGEVNQHLKLNFEVYPVTYATLSLLPDGCEPVIVDDDDYLDIIDLVEDEIILALPDRVLHDDIKICEGNLNVELNERGIIYGRTEIEKVSI